MAHPPAISLHNIHKKYRTGFWGRKFTALDDLSLTVKQGEILGYLGPNGSGKTTTFKVLLDLIRPDRGTVSFFGAPATRQSREGIGFLPENPYYYMYLTAEETLHFQGRLKGMQRAARKRRITELMQLVDLQHAADRQLKKYSRGMLQRIGIAQALINDPDILILDEPMSGLDPMGRKRIRDIILTCRDQGKTVIFSSHILSDVEILCDRAALIQHGKLQGVISVGDMLDNRITHWEITCSHLPDCLDLEEKIYQRTEQQILLRTTSEAEAKKMMSDIEKNGGRIIAFGPQRKSLEDFFLNQHFPESTFS